MKWYKILDFDIFEDGSYPHQLLSAGWSIPFINVKWKVSNGDFVKKGDCLFTCEVNNAYYQRQIVGNASFQKYTGLKDPVIYDGLCVFNSPSDGYVFSKPNRHIDYMCKKSLEICAICDTKEQALLYEKYAYTNLYIGNYSSYKQLNIPIRILRDGKVYKDYTIVTAESYWNGRQDYRRQKLFCHPSLKIWDKKLIKITNWLFLTNDITAYSIFSDTTFYINEDYSIDVKADQMHILVRNEHSLPEFIQFREILGSFYIYFHQTDNDDLITLKGCPNIVHGDFECSRCRLTSFEYAPHYIGGDFIAKTNKLSSFVNMPQYIGGCFNIANNEFDDAAWEYARDNIEGEFCDYNISNNRFVKYRKELY